MGKQRRKSTVYKKNASINIINIENVIFNGSSGETPKFAKNKMSFLKLNSFGDIEGLAGPSFKKLSALDSSS